MRQHCAEGFLLKEQVNSEAKVAELEKVAIENEKRAQEAMDAKTSEIKQLEMLLRKDLLNGLKQNMLVEDSEILSF